MLRILINSMQNTIDITDLFYMSGIGHKGKIEICHQEMSGLEPHPKDDWLYLGLLALKEIAKLKADKIQSAAFIGSGNGIETIAALKLFPKLETIFITDLVKDIQPGIVQNISSNAGEELKGIRTFCLEGRDCQPLLQPVDLIYGNLPLVMVNQEEISKLALSLTTLTDTQLYQHLAENNYDMLQHYSLLSQLGFLQTAREKLASGGSILTFIGGRVPYYTIEECFKRAGLAFRKLFTTFKRQSDPQFLKQYSEYEAKQGMKFIFYDYKLAQEIIIEKLNIVTPEVITGLEDDELKALLVPALLSATQAFEYYLKGMTVGHIAHAFEAWNPDNSL